MTAAGPILFLTPQVPYPPHQGASLRNFYLIKGAAQTHSVDLLSFRDHDQMVDQERLRPLIDLLDRFEVEAVPERSTLMRLSSLLTSQLPDMGHRLESDRFEQKLRQMLTNKRYAIVQIEGIELARYMPVIRAVSPKSHILFDNHNAETDLQRRIFQTDRKSRSPKRLAKAVYSRIQVSKLDQFERQACQMADTVTVVSQADAAIIAHYRRPDQSRVISIPNTLDVEALINNMPPLPHPASDLLFIGKMDYRPNIDGITWFLRRIWPLIMEKRPETQMFIVGKNPTPDILALAEDQLGVTVTGFVDSVEPYLAGTQVMVMPLRMGSGTRLKLIEALASGRPVVSTSLAAEGYDLAPNREVIVADKGADFAEAVLNLLNNEQLRIDLGQNGQKRALSYDWRRVVPRFAEIYASIPSEAST